MTNVMVLYQFDVGTRLNDQFDWVDKIKNDRFQYYLK